jgi:hypothetical protein
VTLGEELRRIEHEIRKLKIAYDLYFIGASPRPPQDQRDAVKKSLMGYQGVHMRNAADRFLYNGLMSRFNAFQEMWNRGVRNREEGVRVHPLASRAAHRAAETETGGIHVPGAKSHARGSSGKRAGAGPSNSWRIPVGRRDDAALKNLYQSFIAAKDSAGDKKRPTFDAFAREIAKHTAALKGKADCDTVEFKIYCKDNKVSIKAKPTR